jgi:hypothetical protein
MDKYTEVSAHLYTGGIDLLVHRGVSPRTHRGVGQLLHRGVGCSYTGGSVHCYTEGSAHYYTWGGPILYKEISPLLHTGSVPAYRALSLLFLSALGNESGDGTSGRRSERPGFGERSLCRLSGLDSAVPTTALLRGVHDTA